MASLHFGEEELLLKPFSIEFFNDNINIGQEHSMVLIL